MLKPGEAYNDPMLGKDPQPAHMKDFVVTRRDNGGVHINSGIPNKAFATFAQEVGGNAWEAPADIWFKARAASGSNPTFSTFAFQTLEAAKSLGKTDLVPKLQAAWEGVGVKPSLTDTGLPKGTTTWIPIVAGAGDTNNGTPR
jgi:Zn-dependent metalloprotease